MIKEYHFGSITIDGKTYNHDVEVSWTGEVLKWWREESHVINVEDVKRAVEQNPETIIIGTGEMGIAKVTEGVKKFIQERGIRLIIDKTEEAVKTFNIILEESKLEDSNPPTTLPPSGRALGKPEKVIGLFHLTC